MFFINHETFFAIFFIKMLSFDVFSLSLQSLCSNAEAKAEAEDMDYIDKKVSTMPLCALTV